jgi:hypothetical protein
MSRKARLVALLVALLAVVAALYHLRLSPHAKAKRLVERMHETPVGHRWFALLRELAVTVRNPEDYVRECSGERPGATVGRMMCGSKLQLARRLLRDGATDLVPGIVSILETTPSEQIIPDDPEASLDSVMAAAEGMTRRIDSLMAFEAISNMGKDARPALPVVIRIVEKQRSSTTLPAISALGGIGDPSATHTLARCLRRSDLQSDDRKVAFHCLCRIGKLSSGAQSELMDALLDADPEVRRHAAVALGLAGVPDAAPALVDLLSGSADSSAKSEAVMALVRLPHLPEPVVARLRELQEAGIPGVSERAMMVLSLRDPRSRRGSANQPVQPAAAKEPRR